MPDPAALVREADELCDRADTATLAGGWDDENAAAKFDRLARRALKLYREAARLSPDPERGRLFLRCCELAEVLELHKAVVALVREACQGAPDYETVERLKDHWDCSCWDGKPFPEPKSARSLTLLDRKDPIPGQLSFLDRSEAPVVPDDPAHRLSEVVRLTLELDAARGVADSLRAQIDSLGRDADARQDERRRALAFVRTRYGPAAAAEAEKVWDMEKMLVLVAERERVRIRRCDR